MRTEDRVLFWLAKKGVLTTQTAAELGLSRSVLTRLVQVGKVVRIARGKYILAESARDTLFLLQQLDASLVYSHETSLYLLGYYTALPDMPTATLPQGCQANKKALSEQPLRLYHVPKPLYELGLTAFLSSDDHWVYAYNMERTICDVLRHRYRGCSQELLIDLLTCYLRQPQLHHLDCLHEYAQIMQIDRLLNSYIDLIYRHLD